MEEAFGDHGHDEVALSAGLGCEQGVQTETAHGPEHGLDVTVREVALDEEGVGGGEELLARQGAADDVDQVGGEVGEIAESFVEDSGADAEGTAEEVGLVDPVLVVASCSGHMNWSSSGRHSQL